MSMFVHWLGMMTARHSRIISNEFPLAAIEAQGAAAAAMRPSAVPFGTIRRRCSAAAASPRRPPMNFARSFFPFRDDFRVDVAIPYPNWTRRAPGRIAAATAATIKQQLMLPWRLLLPCCETPKMTTGPLDAALAGDWASGDFCCAQQETKWTDLFAPRSNHMFFVLVF